MALYRKKPVVIEAAVYAPGMEDGFKTKDDDPDIAPDAKVPFIHTLEGHHYIEPGDYIITGIKGERYPCKPDIFEATYEPVEHSDINLAAPVGMGRAPSKKH